MTDGLCKVCKKVLKGKAQKFCSEKCRKAFEAAKKKKVCEFC